MSRLPIGAISEESDSETLCVESRDLTAASETDRDVVRPPIKAAAASETDRDTVRPPIKAASETDRDVVRPPLKA
jgi:hypothetical protein